MKNKKMTREQTEQVTLKEFLTTKIDNLEKKVDLVLTMNKDALDKADQKLDERLQRMNEFREQLNEQSKTFITRQEFDLAHKGRRDNIALLFSGIGIIIAIIAVILKVS